VKNQICLLLLFCLLKTTCLFAQNDYQKGWEYLNNADVTNAIPSFEKALKEKSTKTQAQLALTLLYDAVGKPEKASALFNDFYDNSSDPFNELFALWFETGVVGTPDKHKPYQLNLMKKIENDPRAKGKFDEIIKYRLITHYTYANNIEKYNEYDQKISSIKYWAMVGPFDNVMNSGFNKDFAVLQNPTSDKSFQSRYGADIQWFTPDYSTLTGYNFKSYNFFSTNSIVYTQSFIESPEEKDALMKIGYSGSLKVWLNDSLAYTEQDRRNTEIDYFQIKCHLNKGFNRILVQLGDYEETYPSFYLRFTDLTHNSLNLSAKAQYQAYQKNKGSFTQIPFFATEGLKKKAGKNDILYQLLLVKAYLRAYDIYAAEEILSDLYATYPKNYLLLRQLIAFYRDTGNSTEQSKTYEIYKELYPDDFEVLATQIKEATDKTDKNKVKEFTNQFKNKYPYADLSISLGEIIVLALDENIDKASVILDEILQKYPDNSQLVLLKYNVQKSLTADPKTLNEILENYLKENNNFSVAESLRENYVSQGRIDDAIKNLEGVKKFAKDPLLDKKIINLLSRKRDYDGAIKVALNIMKNRPSDYENLADLATLHKMKNEKEKALFYYKEALRYFPFSFEYNERIRELNGQKAVFDLTGGISPAELISAYEKEFITKNKQPFDIIIDKKSLVIFKTKSTGYRRSYIVKINQESAIEEWQKIQLSAETNMDLQVNELKTIKKNGNKIDAERNGDDVVFTNLEVGDYIYVDYIQKQIDGSKSALFIYDNFNLTSYTPTYKRDYFVYAEEGVTLKDTIINGSQKPQLSKAEGFNIYSWKITSPEVMKDEIYPLPFSDIGTMVHINLGYTWQDIAQWYSDLSEKQAQPDFTIRSITKSLFEGKNYSDEQKAKIIYDFVCKNIQYSSIDFRQGSYIPQKASTVYHTRLGDCKDVSTLYASIARTAGLDVNLVLINTRDNGQKDVVLPSLNFNHCIVKVNLKNGSKYLELTDTDLPYASLYYTHNGASILEIPTRGIPKNTTLSTLKLNSGYLNKVIREGSILVNSTNNIVIKNHVIKTGNQAGNTCKSYYYEDEDKRKEGLKKDLETNFTSGIKINSLTFEKLEPRKDTASYSYDYSVENEIKKVGSFKTLKIPFSDVIAKMNIFEDGQRVFDFDYNYYEPVDYYEETLMVNLDNPIKLLEVPENIHLTFKDNVYDLTFTKVDEQHLKVKRSYQSERKNISAKDFEAFKTFITKVVEAENTSLVLK
jgi:tetratricopeptide (TPR) repeat protein/transglutaminase-like putative cysteine protease